MCPHARPIKKVYRNYIERKKDIMQNSNGYGIASNLIFVRVCDVFSEEIWCSIINSSKNTA